MHSKFWLQKIQMQLFQTLKWTAHQQIISTWKISLGQIFDALQIFIAEDPDATVSNSARQSGADLVTFEPGETQILT